MIYTGQEVNDIMDMNALVGSTSCSFVFFFFQAEDGIRDLTVTGVQTCALPIYSQVVEPGPPPFLTSEGIFLIYNGADDKFVYSTGWVLFDKTDPTKVLARADHPIFWPRSEEHTSELQSQSNLVCRLLLEKKKYET